MVALKIGSLFSGYGWITDCGLSRSKELKAAGNGVVPQQAALALTILLEGVEW